MVLIANLCKGFFTSFAVVLKWNLLCRVGMMWCVHLCQLGIFTGHGLKQTSKYVLRVLLTCRRHVNIRSLTLILVDTILCVICLQ